MGKRPGFLVVNGPNLNLLGEREPAVYGRASLAELEETCRKWAFDREVEVRFAQSNSEGVLIDILHEHRKDTEGIVLNAAAYTHYSYALRDCIAALVVPVIEVHISNPEAREDFRHKSVISPVVRGKITGLGIYGYILALEALMHLYTDQNDMGDLQGCVVP